MNNLKQKVLEIRTLSFLEKPISNEFRKAFCRLRSVELIENRWQAKKHFHGLVFLKCQSSCV